MQFKTAVQMGMGISGFVVWSYTSFMGISLPDDYLQFVKGVVIGMAALALRDMPPPAPKQPEVIVGWQPNPGNQEAEIQPPPKTL